MQKQQKQKQHNSINWTNLFLWSLLIVSFILAIVAISKSGKDGKDGPSEFVQPTTDHDLNTLRDSILTDVDKITFKNGHKFQLVGNNLDTPENIQLDIGDNLFIVNGNNDKQAVFSLNVNSQDYIAIGTLAVSDDQKKYFYYNKDNVYGQIPPPQ